MAERKTRKLVHDSDRKVANKKAIIISSIVIGLLAIAGTILGILWGIGVFDKEEKTYTYFKDLADRKLNTVEVLNYVEEKEHVFLFIYNNEELDAKEGETDEEFNEQDNEIVKQVLELSKKVDECNEKLGLTGDDRLYYLFLVDTSIAGNETIYENSSLGAVSADEDPALTYFYRGINRNDVPEELKDADGKPINVNDYVITYKGTNKKQLVNVLKDSKNYFHKLTFKEEK